MVVDFARYNTVRIVGSSPVCHVWPRLDASISVLATTVLGAIGVGRFVRVIYWFCNPYEDYYLS